MKLPNSLLGSNRSIIKTFRRGLLAVIILAVVFITALWIIQQQRNFNARTEKIRKDYLQMRKEFVKNQTNSVIRYINAQYNKQENLLKQKIQKDVQRAIRIADNLYQKNRGKLPEDELKNIILEALRNLYKGNEYVFVVRMDGTELLYPVAPKYEGKNLMDLKDARGKYVIREEISVLSKKDKDLLVAIGKNLAGKKGNNIRN